MTRLALEGVVVRPLFTEKVSSIIGEQNTYGFQVNLKANKNQIKLAVEKLYGVRVFKVCTMINPGKLRRRKTKVHKTSKWKKALVQVDPEQKIKLFKDI